MNTLRKNQKKDGKAGHLNFAVPKNNIAFENFGWQKCDGTETGGNLRRRNYSLYVVLGGNGYYNVGRAKYRLSEQDIFLVKPEETVSFYPDARNPWEYVYFSFNEDGAEEFLKKIGLENSLIGSINSVETIKIILEKLQKATLGKSYGEYSFTGYVYEIIGEIVKNKTETTFSTENSKKLISEAVNYVASNFGENISVIEMSKYLCIERTTLFRLFKDNFGISPFLTNLKRQKNLSKTRAARSFPSPRNAASKTTRTFREVLPHFTAIPQRNSVKRINKNAAYTHTLPVPFIKNN